jgi:hypothetical protein
MPNEIKVSVDYDLPNPPPNPPPNPALPPSPSTVDDNVSNPSDSSLSGSGDASGASTDATVPNTSGGTENRQRKNPVPPGCIFKKATIRVSLSCAALNKTITLEATGNVSVSGKIDANCIYTTAVNTTTISRVIETKTTTQKKCCGDKEEETK